MKRTVALLAATLGALPILAPTTGSAQTSTRTGEVAKDIVVSYPETWTPAEAQYSNALELVTPAEKLGVGVGQARLLITTEWRRDHAKAVRRLAEIAAEVDAPPTFLELGGWPALERRYLAPLARRGQESVPEGQDLVLRVTTVIAAGDLVIRLETVLPPGADSKPADEAVSIGRSATFPSRGQPAEVGEELRLLRERPLTPSPPVSPLGGPGSSPAPGAPVQVQTGVGELEIVVSTNGQNVVVAANRGFSFSSNGGGSFTFGGHAGPLPSRR